MSAEAFGEELARAVFSAFPVTKVRLTNREPLVISSDPKRGWYGWYSPRNGDVTKDEESSLIYEDSIWDRLVGYREGDFLGRLYPTRELAIAALNAACVTWGRSLANQPPLI